MMEFYRSKRPGKRDPENVTYLYFRGCANMRSQLNTLEAVRHRKKPLVTVAHFCAAAAATYASWSGSMGIQGSFSQNQSDTTSWNFNTNDSYTPPSPTDGTGGGWQSSGSGATVDSGSSSFSYSGGWGCVGSDCMQENGGAGASFCYTKVYSDGASGWQVLPSTTGKDGVRPTLDVSGCCIDA